VDQPDKVQNDFLSVMHAGRKVNHDVDVSEHRFEQDGKVVLAFHIQENPRTRKPVYIDGDIRKTFRAGPPSEADWGAHAVSPKKQPRLASAFVAEQCDSANLFQFMLVTY
jgi:hypothetical protein